MAQKIRNFTLPFNIDLKISDIKILCHLRKFISDEEGSLRISYKCFAKEVELSSSTIQRSSSYLKELGLIHIENNVGADGIQESNSYSLTRIGRQMTDQLINEKYKCLF